uniref:Cytochrome c oxidase subunit 2 n=1 Tax=Timema podura TaxID=61482 RepID=A0A097CTK8_TIMPD|nr:cytochrome oxidase subunit II [Timema podura]
MSTWANLSFQNSASPIMEQLIFFHDHAMMILTMVVMMVLYLMWTLMENKQINRNLLEGNTIEIVWTITPAIILLFIAIPSLRLLYLIDEISNPFITLKTIGHQWYWSYEYTDFNKIEFDSYMIPSNESQANNLRLLNVDNHTVLPSNVYIRVMVTAADVLHSWAMPSLGIKVDGTPGRLNQTSTMINRVGLFFGQCSEICGTNHSFMPITVESVTIMSFLN